MWDNAKLLDSTANVIFIFGVLAILYGTIHYVVHLPKLLPLSSVRLETVPQRVSAEGVAQVARNEMRGNLFTVDIERVRRSMEKLPWVRSVSIRREFPNLLAVKLEEHRVLAKWNSNELVNQYGEVFAVEADWATKGDGELPEFVGMEGTSAEITNYYGEFSRQLESVGLRMAKLTLSPRHALQLRLRNGVVLELGREDVQQRLARFVEIYPYSLAAEQGKLKYVDLRYRNGFAVGGLGRQG